MQIKDQTANYVLSDHDVYCLEKMTQFKESASSLVYLMEALQARNHCNNEWV